MRKLLKLYKKFLNKLYKDKYYDKVLVVCNERVLSRDIAFKLEAIVRKLHGHVIYYKSNQMFLDTKYGYIHVVFDSVYNPHIHTGRHDYLCITSTEASEYINVLKPKAAFNAIFKKEVK